MTEDIINRVDTALTNYKNLSSQLMEKITVDNKSLEEWRATFFNISFSSNMTPMRCRDLSAELLRLNQIASRHYIEANTKLSMVTDAYDLAYRETYQALILEYQAKQERLPAASLIETIAKASTDEVKSLASVAEFEKNFWRDVINYITRKRKQLENITMNNALMNKIEGYTLNAEDNESEKVDAEASIWG